PRPRPGRAAEPRRHLPARARAALWFAQRPGPRARPSGGPDPGRPRRLAGRPPGGARVHGPRPAGRAGARGGGGVMDARVPGEAYAAALSGLPGIGPRRLLALLHRWPEPREAWDAVVAGRAAN